MAIFNMTPYDKYVFCLCMVVFVALTALFTVLMLYLLKLIVRLIRHGAEDEKILKEYEKNKGKKKKVCYFDVILTSLLCILVFSSFGYSVYMKYVEKKNTGSVPVYRVVASASMSKKHEKNEYLFQNNLNGQFNRFDLILTHELPPEEQLKLYDVVVYEIEDVLVVHRIVGIEEPNDEHPEERWFLLQGDNVEKADRFPVHYSQMRAIYKGTRIPYVGSFVTFLQSPAGYICILLIVFGVVSLPLLDKKIEKEKAKRLALLLAMQQKEKEEELLKKVESESRENEPQKEYYFVRCARCCPYTCPYVCPYKQELAEKSECSKMQ